MKVHSLQYLRAGAAWLVVFHHYMQIVHDFQHTTILGYIFSWYGDFGVDVFFVISGFVMYYTVSIKEYSVQSFLIGRLVRIAPAYWVATMVLLAASLVYQEAYAWTKWTPESLVQSLLFIPNENPSGIGVYPFLTVGWTLNIEIFFYGLLGFSLILGKPRQFLVCGALLVVIPFVWHPDWVYGHVLSNKMLVEFVIGLAIGYMYLNWPSVRGWAQNNPIIAPLLLTGSMVFLYMGMREFAACGIVLTGLSLERNLERVKYAGILALALNGTPAM